MVGFSMGLGAFGAFVLTFLGIKILQEPALRLGLVDEPNRRKRHEGRVPLTGGVALLIALVLTGAFAPLDWSQYWPLPVGMLILGLIGVLDDLQDLSSLFRLLVQLFVATLMVAGGLSIGSLGDLLGTGAINLGWLGAPFTILCVVFMVNAINMMDGMDGLVGIIGLLTAVGLMVLAFANGLVGRGYVAFLLVAGLLAFLLFNLRTPWLQQARVFLGDSGSMVLGFVLAWLAVALTQAPVSTVAPISVAWLLLLPAADSLSVFLRRLRSGRNLWSPDRGHLHHILLRGGFSVPMVVLILGVQQLIWVGLAVILHMAGTPDHLQFALVLLAFLGYFAFSLNARSFLRRRGHARRRRMALRLKIEAA